jgi:hypothetical protein
MTGLTRELPMDGPKRLVDKSVIDDIARNATEEIALIHCYASYALARSKWKICLKRDGITFYPIIL